MTIEVVALVSCGKAKRHAPAAAKDLYTSMLFKGMRTFAEARADRWFVLSAQHGFTDPTKVIEPYEKTLKQMSKTERTEWGLDVARSIRETIPIGSVLMIMAGAAYVRPLERHLADDYALQLPLAGMALGRRQQWLTRENSENARAVSRCLTALSGKSC